MAAPAIVDHISELSAILKTVFGESVQNQQNLAAMLYKRFGESSIRFGGNCYEFPARMANAQSVGARGYRTALPEPLANTDVTCRVRQKFLYATFDITGPDIEKGKGNVNAFTNTLTDKMRSLTEMMLKDMNMQTYLDGTGVRATIAAGIGAGNYLYVDQVKYLRVGMQINFIDATDGATLIADSAPIGESDSGDSSAYANKRYTISVIDVSTSQPRIQVTGDAGATVAASAFSGGTPNMAAGDFIVRHKSAGSELVGLGAIVDDGVWNTGTNLLQDIDRTANPLWRAKVIDLNGADLSLNVMQIAMDIPEVMSGRRIDMIVGSYNARDRYLQQLVPQKRFQDLKLDGGFQVLEYNGREFLVDIDCPDSQVFFLNRDSIKKFGLFDLAFVEQAGGILKHDSLASGDVFYGYMRALCNFGTFQANANSKLVELAVNTDYVVAA